jgi:hypothetical protein
MKALKAQKLYYSTPKNKRSRLIKLLLKLCSVDKLFIIGAQTDIWFNDRSRLSINTNSFANKVGYKTAAKQL